MLRIEGQISGRQKGKQSEGKDPTGKCERGQPAREETGDHLALDEPNRSAPNGKCERGQPAREEPGDHLALDDANLPRRKGTDADALEKRGDKAGDTER